jgi:hypothetical protein
MDKLGAASRNYAHSWEGYASLKGDKYSTLKKEIERATINEILSQYNAICADKLWNGPLGEVYHQELLERILSDATFTVMTVWRSVAEWLQNPYASVQLGFDESYPVVDAQNEPIFEGDPVATYFTVSNDQLPEEIQRDLIQNFLNFGSNLSVTARIEDNNIFIIRVGDVSVMTPRTTQELSTEVTVPLTIYHTPDLHLLYLMIDNILKKNYEMINLYTSQFLDEEYIDSSGIQVEVVSLPPVEELIKKIKDKSNYPELWKKIHITAFKCTDLKKFSEWIWDVCKDLPCSECKYHMLGYIQNNPPNNLIPTSSDVEINIAFYWSWKFHNAVNSRLGKPEYAYESALAYYSKLI